MARFALPEFSPELTLAVACARWPLGEAGQQQIHRLAEAPLDWNLFLAWVGRHRVAPLAYRNLRQAASPGIPAFVLDQLSDQHARNTRQVLTQISEAGRIKRMLADAAIRSMIIKGPVLSLLVFDDPTLRSGRDVDLYVDRNRVQDADRLIMAAGYRRFAPDFQLTPRQHEAFLRMRCQFAYHSAQAGVIQELHWRLSSNAALIPLEEGSLWSRASPVHLSGTDFMTLPYDEMFLYLCVHGSVHVWFRFKWLADIAALLHRMSAADVARIATLARALELERPFHQALLLSHVLMAAPVPEKVLTSAIEDKAACRMALAACRAINWGASPSEPADTRWFNTWVGLQAYRIKPTLRYRWAELQDQMCNPEDWQRLPLPEALFFLYLPLRPLSWAARKLKGRLAI